MYQSECDRQLELLREAVKTASDLALDIWCKEPDGFDEYTDEFKQHVENAALSLKKIHKEIKP